MSWWRPKSPTPTTLPAAAPQLPAIVDSDSFTNLASLVAAEAGERKSFDWNHYMSMVGGATSSMFAGEFNLIPTGRIIKAGLITEPWINACTRAISRQFQSTRFILKMETSGDGKVQVIKRHPLLDYLHNAGSDVEDNAAFYSNCVADLVLPGNAYWWNSEDLKTKRRLPAERVEPVIENNRIVCYRILDKGELGLTGASQSKVQLAPEEVTHIRLPNPFSPHIGLSMVIAVTLPLLIDKYGREYVVGFFLRGGTTSGIIETSTSNMEQLMRLARTMMQAFGGRKNMHADKILPAGASWKGQGSSFGELKLVELMKDNVGHFRAATGCTNTVLGIVENIVYATAKAEMELFWKSTILPLQGLVCGAIKASLWDRFGLDGSYDLAFDNAGIEWIDDFDRKLDQDVKLASVATINERRERLGMKVNDRFGDKMAAELVKPPTTPGAPAPATEAAGPADAGAAEAAANAVTAPQASLNGAQVTSMIEIVVAVAEGKLPRASGVAMLATAFALSNEQAEAIMGDVGHGFDPTGAPAAADTPVPPTPPEPPPPPGDAGAKALPASGEALMRWKAEETTIQDPSPGIYALFKSEFQQWQEIILANVEHRSLAAAAIMKRADNFARSFASEATVSAMRAYEHQLAGVRGGGGKTLRGTVVKEAPADRRAKLELLRERAAQVISQGIFESGRRGFVGYSETAMDSIYAFISDELDAGKSLADVASGVRTKFAESYGTEEAYQGQAETIVRTEYSSAISIGQAKFGDDLATVTQRMSKTWVTLEDDHVRDSHAEAEAGGPIEGPSDEVVNASFANGLRYPRESGAPAEEVINCRCSVIYDVTDWGDE